MNCYKLFEIKRFPEPVVFFTERRKVKDFAKIIQNLPQNSIIIIREYDLNRKMRENFAKKILEYTKNTNLKVLIGKDLLLAKKLQLDGVHFSDSDKLPASLLNKSFRKRNFILSISCHNLQNALKALKLRPNILFISPIFQTTTHKNAKIIGIIKFAKILWAIKKKNFFNSKIYALGGVNIMNVRKLHKLNIAAFGAIDYFK